MTGVGKRFPVPWGRRNNTLSSTPDVLGVGKALDFQSHYSVRWLWTVPDSLLLVQNLPFHRLDIHKGLVVINGYTRSQFRVHSVQTIKPHFFHVT